MNNKKGSRGCGACSRDHPNPETERWERVSFLDKQNNKSSTGNLTQTLQSILHQNRSKRKLGLASLDSESSPRDHRLVERNRDTPTNKSVWKLPEKSAPNSSLQTTLKELKQKYTEAKCKVGKHENAKLVYICLDTSCKNNRLGCAHCFVELHEGHKKIKCDEFLKKFTNGYLRYLENFGDMLKCITTIRRKQEERLNIEINHLRESFNINLQKLQHNLKAELKDRLNASLSKQRHVLEESTNCIHLMAELQNSSSLNRPFSQKLNALVSMDYESINDSLQVSLAELQKLRNEDYAAQLKQHIHHINSGISQLFFSELSANRNKHSSNTRQPNYDSLGFVERFSVHEKLQTLKYMSVEKVQLSSSSPKHSTIEVLKKCPCTNKLFLNPQADLSSCQPSEGINTLTLFSCCSGRFCCSQCHNEQQGHLAEQSNPSERVCSICEQIFEVPFGNSIPINCRACFTKSRD